LVQDTAAVICLRPENEISFNSLIQDLTGSLNYPIETDRIYQSLQHLRRGGLIEVDWHNQVIKRIPSIKEYVTKQVIPSKTWQLAIDDWLRINRAIQEKYGETNPEFQDLLTPRPH
jgi:DNA-binding PadR family transcriptional regulator